MLLTFVQWYCVGIFGSDFYISDTMQFITEFHVFSMGVQKQIPAWALTPYRVTNWYWRCRDKSFLHFLDDGITCRKMLHWITEGKVCQYIGSFQVMFPFKHEKIYNLQNLLSFHSQRVYRILFRFSYYVFRLGFLFCAIYKKIFCCFTYYTNIEVQYARNVILSSG